MYPPPLGTGGAFGSSGSAAPPLEAQLGGLSIGAAGGAASGAPAQHGASTAHPSLNPFSPGPGSGPTAVPMYPPVHSAPAAASSQPQQPAVAVGYPPAAASAFASTSNAAAPAPAAPSGRYPAIGGHGQPAPTQPAGGPSYPPIAGQAAAPAGPAAFGAAHAAVGHPVQQQQQQQQLLHPSKPPQPSAAQAAAPAGAPQPGRWVLRAPLPQRPSKQLIGALTGCARACVCAPLFSTQTAAALPTANHQTRLTLHHVAPQTPSTPRPLPPVQRLRSRGWRLRGVCDGGGASGHRDQHAAGAPYRTLRLWLQPERTRKQSTRGLTHILQPFLTAANSTPPPAAANSTPRSTLAPAAPPPLPPPRPSWTLTPASASSGSTCA
jgi:hypothetical protein